MSEPDEQKASQQIQPDTPAKPKDEQSPRDDGVDRAEEKQRGNESF